MMSTRNDRQASTLQHDGRPKRRRHAAAGARRNTTYLAGAAFVSLTAAIGFAAESSSPSATDAATASATGQSTAEANAVTADLVSIETPRTTAAASQEVAATVSAESTDWSAVPAQNAPNNNASHSQSSGS